MEHPDRGGRDLRVLPGGTDPANVAALLGALREVLDAAAPGTLAAGRPPVLVPVDAGADLAAAADGLRARVPAGVPAEGVDVVVQTSGSTTGRGHLVGISAAALRASAQATHARLAGPGTWLLCLPAHHIAGVQVLVRSALAGTDPVVLDVSAGFSVDAFVAAALRARDDAATPLYCSVVPTQLVRLLDFGRPDALDALRAFDAILVGGAATAPHVLDRARAAGVRAVTTYGMSETGGGCVYDGRPLDGVGVRVDDDGRVLLSGPMVAHGYLDDPAASAATFLAAPGGTCTVRTSDRGELTVAADGTTRLRVLGRMDDLIITGGIKVDPGVVAAVVAALPGIAEACVVGVPDPEWGQRVVAVVVPAHREVLRDGTGAGLVVAPPPELARVRDAVKAALSPAHAPRDVLLTAHLPLRGPGKIDRRAVAAAAAGALDRSGDASPRLGS